MKDSVIAVSLVALLFVTGCSSTSSTTSAPGSTGDSGKHAYITPTDDSFEQEVLKSSQPVLVDFTAIWCPPCQKLAPSIAELAVEFEGRAKVAKVDVDACPKTVQEYGVGPIPALLFFKDGKVVDQLVGFQSKDTLASKLNGLLKK